MDLIASNLPSIDSSKPSLNNNISSLKAPKLKKIKIEKNKDTINSHSNQSVNLIVDHSNIHQDSAIPASPDGK